MAAPRPAEERRKVLANRLTHKLRNYLNGMRAHVALLERFAGPDADPRRLRQLQRLEEAIGGMERLISEYLILVSPDSNQWAEADLPVLLRQTVEAAVSSPQGQGIAFQEEYSPRLPKVLLDPNKFRRALACLVDNACQAMPTGGTLTLRARVPVPGRVLVEVIDTGVGIAGEDQRRIFEPFFSTKPDRLGLGLAVARRLLQDLGGRLEFESRPGQGTTFRLSLPNAARQRAALARRRRRDEWLQPIP